jgi:hypothetical protein
LVVDDFSSTDGAVGGSAAEEAEVGTDAPDTAWVPVGRLEDARVVMRRLDDELRRPPC